MEKMKKTKFLFVSTLLMLVFCVATSCENQQNQPAKKYFSLELIEKSKTIHWDGKEHTPYTVKVKEGAPRDYQIGNITYTLGGVTTTNSPKDEGSYIVQVPITITSDSRLNFVLSDHFAIVEPEWPETITYTTSVMPFNENGKYTINEYDPAIDGIPTEDTVVQYELEGKTYDDTTIVDTSLTTGRKYPLLIKLRSERYGTNRTYEIMNAISIAQCDWPENITYQQTVHEYSAEGNYKFDVYDPTVDGLSEDTMVYYKLDDNLYDSIDFTNKNIKPLDKFQLEIVLKNKNYSGGYHVYSIAQGYQIAALSWPNEIDYSINTLEYNLNDAYEINTYDPSSFIGTTNVQYKINNIVFDSNVIYGLNLDVNTFPIEIILTNKYYEGGKHTYTFADGLTITFATWPQRITYVPVKFYNPSFAWDGHYTLNPYEPLDDNLPEDTIVQYMIDNNVSWIYDSSSFVNTNLNQGSHTITVILQNKNYLYGTKSYSFDFEIGTASWPTCEYDSQEIAYTPTGEYKIQPFDFEKNKVAESGTTITYTVNGKEYTTTDITDNTIVAGYYDVIIKLNNSNYLPANRTLIYRSNLHII